MKIVFFGSGDFIRPVLQVLEEKFELVPKKGDLGIIASYGKILPKDFIQSFKFGILNIHPSLLPKYRGPTPAQTAILNGDKISGVTIIKLDEEVDHGPILAQNELRISENDTSESLLKRSFKLGAEMLPEIISKYIKRQIKITPQDDSKATFTDHLTKNNGLISLKNPPEAEKLDRMIRAYYPWPGVWFKAVLSGKEQIIKLLPKKQIQVESKNPMGYKDFINGYKEGDAILSALSLG